MCVIITVQLKLKRPSRTKRELIDNAMLRYTQALQYLINNSNLESLAQLSKGVGSVRRIASRFDKQLLHEINRFFVQPFKDSLKLDAASYIVSALNRSRNSDKSSSICLDDKMLNSEFDSLITKYDNDELGKRSLSKQLTSLYPKYMAQRGIYFGRYAKNRDYCLLQGSSGLFAKLYLLNVQDKARRGGLVRKEAGLHYLTDDESPLEQDNRRERYIVVPLEYGEYQKKILMYGIEDKSRFKTARLVKRNNDYYLCVGIECPSPKEREHKSFMGICRSVSDSVSYCITDTQGNPLAYDKVYLPDSNPLHTVAKKLSVIADNYCAQVITYRLGTKSDSLADANATPSLSTSEFNKLTDLLSYKLRMTGLPAPTIVSPRSIFYTCPRCGQFSNSSRFCDKVFMCIYCGYAENIERLGSFNLANMLIDYRQRKVAFHSRQQPGKMLSFSNELLGINFQTEFDDKSVERFYEFLAEHVSSMSLGNEISRTKRSIYTKLKTAKNLLEETVVIFNS